LRASGFSVKPIDVENTSVHRQRFGVPESMGSCHTAVVGGYVIEGHVHAREIKRLLKEKPNARGLAVPGMPGGSPGMEDSKRQSYTTYILDERGKTSVFARH
jgi:hypothetical protein